MKILTTTMFAALMMFGVGCGKVDNAIDCQSICDRYRSCYDADYDVNGCASRCRDDSSRDADYQRKADVCEACIDGRACSSATFNCAVDCGGIVP